MTRKTNHITVEQFFKENEKELRLKIIVDEGGFSRRITETEIHRPGLALAGFVDVFSYNRIQVLGNTEAAYLRSLPEEVRRRDLQRLLEFEIPLFVVTNKNPVDEELAKQCRAKKIPLLQSELVSTEFVRYLNEYLSEVFAPRVVVHGTLIDVYGIGVLLTGRSGIGKSEVALDLVERGHRLVSDDAVEIIRKARGILIGQTNSLLRHHIELRGLGIVNIQSMFGIRAIRVQKRIEIEVQLEDWNEKEDYERLGVEDKFAHILGVRIPLVRLPIFPGKNITVIVETIALNQLLKIHGINPAKRFNELLMKRIQEKKEVTQYLKNDFE
ncbi:HPr kinase/phosphorylase [bacterium BMS3Abin05]|nr:HPr kinase/phosphorylase [bacterium BMS3Abin05]GBE26957.1 HPr kinase/phosphorylase [bacterium BMS3Bbin03]